MNKSEYREGRGIYVIKMPHPRQSIKILRSSKNLPVPTPPEERRGRYRHAMHSIHEQKLGT